MNATEYKEAVRRKFKNALCRKIDHSDLGGPVGFVVFDKDILSDYHKSPISAWKEVYEKYVKSDSQ